MTEERPQYVTRLMKAKCSFGSMSQYLNLPKDHGVWYHSEDTPIMNANDHEPEQHILHFGRCTSSKNPSNMLSFEEVMLGALLAPAGGMLLGILGSRQLKKLLGCDGCKCRPLTITPWEETDEDYYIDGAPAITLKSYLNCYYGGKITIDKEDEGEGADANNVEETVEENPYNAMRKLPASMQNKINSICGDQGEGTSDFENVIAAGDVSMYAVSPQTSQENYQHNQSQSIPNGAVSENGNITNPALLGQYKMGNGTLASQGEGVIAAYNILNMLSKKPNLSNIIRFFELLPYIMGNQLPGANAYGFVAVLMYMMAQNLDVSVAARKKSKGKQMQEKRIQDKKTPDKMKKADKLSKEKEPSFVAVTGRIVTKEDNKRSVLNINSNPVVGKKEELQDSLEESQLMLMVGASESEQDKEGSEQLEKTTKGEEE